MKPTVSDLENGFTPVEYFIYRCLKRENFVTASNNIVPQNDPLGTGLTNGIWADAAFFQALDPSIVASEKAFGWDKVSSSDSTLLTEIFYEDNDDNQLYHVSQGTLIGYFEGAPTSEGGFEIILKDRLYLPNLGMLRAEENKIITSSAPGGGDIPGNEPIARMREREQILNFVDPAAYMMMFYEGGIHVRNQTASSVDCLSYVDIYSNVVSKFTSKNTLYIDIRNENGYSLNYYKDNEGLSGDTDYGKHVNYSLDGANFTAVIHYTNFWPVFSFTPSADHSNTYNSLNLKFQNHYNPSPLIYLDFAHTVQKNAGNWELCFPKGSWKFLDDPVTVPAPIDWSNGITINTLNINTLIGDTQPSWIVRLINIRTVPPVGISLPPSVIPRNNYADNLFGPINELPTFLGTGKTQWVSGTGKKFLNANDELGVAGICETGIGISNDDVIFFAELIDYYSSSESEENSFLFEKFLVPYFVSTGSTNNKLLNGIDSNLSSFKVNFRQEEYIVATVTRKIHAVIHADSCEPVNDFFTFLITRAEFDFLINNITLNHDFHEALIQFPFFIPILDDNFLPIHYISSLNVVGYDNLGILNSQSFNFGVDTVDKFRFNSANAGNALTLRVIDKNPLLLNELTDLLLEIEAVYSDQLKAFNIPLDDSSDKTVTRIRVHHFGKGLKGVAFDKAVPFAPYAEPISSTSTCTSNAIPGTSEFEIFSLPGCRERQLYSLGSFGNELKYESVNRINNTSSLILNNLFIDYGHSFYTLCALLHPGSGLNLGKPDEIFVNAFQLVHALDFTNFVGDLASVISFAYNEQYKINGNYNVPFSLLDSKYTLYANEPDLLGDVDGICLKVVWDYFITLGAPFRFSDIIEYFYCNTVPNPINFTINQNTVNISLHVSKRFTIFSHYFNFINQQGVWTIDNLSGIYIDFSDRVYKFCKFFYGAQFDGYESSLFGAALTFGKSNFDSSSWFSSFQNVYVNYVLDKFLQFIQKGVGNE